MFVYPHFQYKHIIYYMISIYFLNASSWCGALLSTIDRYILSGVTRPLLYTYTHMILRCVYIYIYISIGDWKLERFRQIFLYTYNIMYLVPTYLPTWDQHLIKYDQKKKINKNVSVFTHQNTRDIYNNIMHKYIRIIIYTYIHYI